MTNIMKVINYFTTNETQLRQNSKQRDTLKKFVNVIQGLPFVCVTSEVFCLERQVKFYICYKSD